MKKFLALLLSLLMACSMVAAFADDIAEDEVIVVPHEELYEGVWVQFEDGFELYLPAEWLLYEVTEEMLAGGVFFLAGTEDMAYSCTISWASLGGDVFTIEEVYEQFLLVFPHANLLQVNGVYIVAYQDMDRNTLNCVALDATQTGTYLFTFTPGDEEEFTTLASLIATSIRNIEIAE